MQWTTEWYINSKKKEIIRNIWYNGKYYHNIAIDTILAL